MHLTREEVAAILPQQPPMLLIDTAEVVPNESATATWTVPTEAFWTAAHFPGRPLLPGVLLVEAMAQTAALIAPARDGDGLPLLVGIDRLRLRKPVLPGDTLVLVATVTQQRRSLWKFMVRATRDGERIGDGEIMAVTG